jgi:hypothetical protein
MLNINGDVTDNEKEVSKSALPLLAPLNHKNIITISEEKAKSNKCY